MSDILFVCTGNTCRSPMAQALASSMLANEGMDISVKSAGVFAICGQSMSPNAKAVLKEMGVEAPKHSSQGLENVQLKETKLILTMTRSHLNYVKQKFDGLNAFTLAEYAGEVSDIEDPFGGSVAEYEKCARQIKRLLEKSLPKFKEEFCE